MRELATMGGTLHWLARLARDIGATTHEALDRMWSWDITFARASDALSAAQAEIDREYSEAEAKKRRRKTGRRY